MSTQATIAITGPDGSGYASTLLNDGYPEYAGVKLLLHYNSRPDAETLVQLGTLWTLGDSPAQHPDAFLRKDGSDDRRPNITRAMGREGRTDFGPKKPRPIPPGPDSAFNMVWDTDYVYVLTPEGWRASDLTRGRTQPDEFKPLLQFIHDHYQARHEDCIPGPEAGPGLFACAKHRSHIIRSLKHLLPPEMMPEDRQHFAHRIAN